MTENHLPRHCDSNTAASGFTDSIVVEMYHEHYMATITSVVCMVGQLDG